MRYEFHNLDRNKRPILDAQGKPSDRCVIYDTVEERVVFSGTLIECDAWFRSHPAD